MTTKPLLEGQSNGLGFWHPAMRPDSLNVAMSEEEVADGKTPAVINREKYPSPDQLPSLADLPLERPEQSGYPFVDNTQQTSVSEPHNTARMLDKDPRPSRDYPDDEDTEEIESSVEIPHGTEDLARLSTYEKISESFTGSEVAYRRSEEYLSNKIERSSDSVQTSQASISDIGDTNDGIMEQAWKAEQNQLCISRPDPISRTNSFPEVLPSYHTDSLPSHSLPHSQVEKIMEEDLRAEISEHKYARDAFPSKNSEIGLVQSPSDLPSDTEGEGFFAQAYNAQKAFPTAEADEESRYEEGLPLMSSISVKNQVDSIAEELLATGTAGFDGRHDQDDFFEKAPREAPEKYSSSKPLLPHRKPTTQILDSMHYAPHSETHANPDPEQENLSVAKLTEKNGTSSATVKNENLAEQLQELTSLEPKNEDDLAERWKAALGDEEFLEEDETLLDPSSFFSEDGEGFLDEDNDASETSQSEPVVALPKSNDSAQKFGNMGARQSIRQDKYLPTTATQTKGHLSKSPYDSQTGNNPNSELHYSSSVPGGLTGTIGQQPFGAHPPTTRPQLPSSMQSFADKSKGGYTSPYDLPMDITRPKKRNTTQQMRPSPDPQKTSNRPPPPRSSSMFNSALPPIESKPPIPRVPSAYSSAPASNAVPPPMKYSPNSSGFFEELPLSKSRPSSTLGRAGPPTSHPAPPLSAITSERGLPGPSSLPQVSEPGILGSPQQYQLLPPERMSLFGDVPQVGSTSQATPPLNTRYSPAPAQISSGPLPQNRYAASPSSGARPPPSQTLPFQPRTSSPLTQSSLVPQQTYEAAVAIEPSHRTYQNESISNVPRRSLIADSPPRLSATENAPSSKTSSDFSYPIHTPEHDDNSSQSLASSDQYQESKHVTAMNIAQAPLRRSQTQSPGATRYRADASSSNQIPYQRPASVNHQISTTSQESGLPAPNQARPRGRTLPKQPNYIRPLDGREMDPLERWKGCPIFSFGFGGTIVTSFPKEIPRYATGQNIPMIKCSPGEIRLQDGKIFPLDQDIAAFPGPLKSKSKKREVFDWLSRRIDKLETELKDYAAPAMLPDLNKRHEEKVLLWKIVQILLQHDGIVDGNQTAEKAVRSVLSPELSQGDNASTHLGTQNESLLGIRRHNGSQTLSNATKPEAMEELRKALLHGEREKAVWHAVDNRLWTHALLLSSTLDKQVWKQVAQEFIHQEVKTFGENTESLAALYQVFVGNWDESVDELVPPSARAGLRMVSKTARNGPTKNALDGLDRWRETLTLILSNRSVDDSKALVALGQLLASYGRTEAAHICYIFAKSPGLFGGPDNPQVRVALLGADHIQHPFDYGRDLDSIFLTEAYDFARTALASSTVTTLSPFLQSYKLYHATVLAEYGYKSEAQQYCEAIASALKSTTKPSPYHHSLLFGALDNLQERLRQAPKDNSGSWISKPSIDKVSGSIWAKFNQYVAGDENDVAPTGSGKAYEPDAGPFSKLAGDSPSLSRTPSSSDLYGSFTPGIPVNNSRYALASLYTPRSSLDQHTRPSQEVQKPTQSDLLRPAHAPQQYQSRPTSSTNSRYESQHPITHNVAYSQLPENYFPTPPSQPEYMATESAINHEPSPYQQGTYQPTPPPEPHLSQEEPEQERTYNPEATYGYQPPSSTYNASSSNGYEPSTVDLYAPPSYDQDVSGESPAEEKRLRKQFFMDDNDGDDFEVRAAALRKEEKIRKDREADEAFRRAAEADAQKDKAPKLNNKKSGWFGGWLGSKKEGDAAQATINAPIKAKLGEQSSFYYDAEKKRWIDKKNPDATPAPAAKPPPPKGSSSRAPSAASGPASSTSTPPLPPLPTSVPIGTLPSTFVKTSTLPPLPYPASNHPSPSSSPVIQPPVQSEAVTAESNAPPIPSATGPPSGSPSAPLSRPATGMSGGSEIDDLIGAPQPRQGGTLRKGKKGRGYVDIMAK